DEVQAPRLRGRRARRELVRPLRGDRGAGGRPHALDPRPRLGQRPSRCAGARRRWLMRKPEAYAPMLLTAPRDSDLEAVVETVRELRLEGTVAGVPILFNSLVVASMAAAGAAFQADAGATPDHEIQSLADE